MTREPDHRGAPPGRGATSVAARLSQGPVPRDQALSWIVQAATALDAAHAAGIAHGRLTAADLLVDGDGRVEVAGLRSGAVPTRTGTGTAPDVMALVDVAAELVGGAPRTDAVIARWRRPRPAGRSARAGAFAAQLVAAAGHRAWADVLASGAAEAPRAAPRPRRRHRLLAGAAAALAAAGVATVVAFLVTDHDGGGAQAAGVTRTTTAPAPPPETVLRTVTAPAAPPRVAQEPTTPAAPTPEADPVALTDQATSALSDGRPADALALADRALRSLAGTGALYEGNAAYDRGRALIDLGRCAEAVSPLERAVALRGSSSQLSIRRAALQAARDCAVGGGGPGPS